MKEICVVVKGEEAAKLICALRLDKARIVAGTAVVCFGNISCLEPSVLVKMTLKKMQPRKKAILSMSGCRA